jgi:uncharacterized membrane protein
MTSKNKIYVLRISEFNRNLVVVAVAVVVVVVLVVVLVVLVVVGRVGEGGAVCSSGLRLQ